MSTEKKAIAINNNDFASRAVECTRLLLIRLLAYYVASGLDCDRVGRQRSSWSELDLIE